MHSCWKMKLQVGARLVSRAPGRTVRCRDAVKPCEINMYVRGGSSLERFVNDPFPCDTLVSSNCEADFF